MAVEKVGGGRIHWPAGHVTRPAGRHLVCYPLGQVGGAPPWPYKYPPTGESHHTHDTLEIPLTKLSFLV
jgi:hypothetical protein